VSNHVARQAFEKQVRCFGTTAPGFVTRCNITGPQARGPSEGETIGLELTFQYFLVDHILCRFVASPTFRQRLAVGFVPSDESAVMGMIAALPCN